MSPTLLLALALAAGPSASTDSAAPQPDASAARETEEPAEVEGRRRLARTVAGDFGRLYDVASFRRIGGALVVGGLLANTSADEEIQDTWRDDVRSSGTDDFASAVEGLGDDWAAPAYVVLGLAAEALADGEPGRGPVGWLRRTGRAATIGLPAVYYLQQMTGGNRPSDGLGSDWSPFDGSHGVSGHSFLGALPFLTVVRMSESWWVDALAIAASTAVGFGRLNDDQHYVSQVALGWFLAWEATGAVAPRRTAAGEPAGFLSRALPPSLGVVPYALPDGGGFLFTWRSGAE